MNVLHIIPSIDRARGGTVTYLENVIPHLEINGWSTEILTTLSAYPAGKIKTGCQIHGICASRIHYLDNDLNSFSFNGKALIDKLICNSSIVHIHGLYRITHAVAAKAANRYKKPYIIRPHGSLDPHFRKKNSNKIKYKLWENFIEWPIINNSSFVQCSNLREQEKISLVKGISNIKVSYATIPNPVDFEVLENIRPIKPQALTSDRYFVAVGRIDPQKGYERIIDALSELSERDRPDLIIAGTGDEKYKNSLIARANQRGVENKIIFLGLLSKSELRYLIENCVSYISASLGENFGFANVEAIYYGANVIISDETDTSGEFESMGVAVRFSSFQGRQLIDAMQDACKGFPPINKLHSQVKIRNYCSSSEVARLISEIYNKALKHDRAL